MQKILLALFWVGASFVASAQNGFPISIIPDSLLLNAHAIIRQDSTVIEVTSLDEIIVSKTRVITVLNKDGRGVINAFQNYDEGTKIKEQRAWIYGENGEQLEKFKEKDFKDQSNFESFVLFSDNRVSFLDYTPRSYPYTVKYTSKVKYTNSAFIPDFYPLESYKVSTQNKTYQILNPQSFKINFQKVNFENFELEENVTPTIILFKMENLVAIRDEPLNPSLIDMIPRIKVSLEKFVLEGVEGTAASWEEFGRWYYEKLLKGRDKLPQSTINEISKLTKNASTLEEKARIIYQYVQDKTRYVAVMLGIGGWRPALASEVDKLGYGDCKALTNYTMALMQSQGIESYYSVVWSGTKRHMDPEFPSMMGNHVILNIPMGEENIWLECTNQDVPFDYNGDNTDDRYVLRIKPQGGELVKTHTYNESDNLESVFCTLKLDVHGGFKANLKRISTGKPYGERMYIIKKELRDQKNFYRREWGRFQNIQFEEISLENDKENIIFKENIRFSGDNLARKAGNRLLLPLNFIHQSGFALKKLDERLHPLKLTYGKSFEDVFHFELPEGYEIESVPAGGTLKTAYGSFSIKIKEMDERSIHVSRSLVFKEGEWPAEQYEEFRVFLQDISKLNNLKAVILKSEKS